MGWIFAQKTTKFFQSAPYTAYAQPNQFVGAPTMTTEEELYSGSGPLIGLLLVVLPWLSLFWPPLFAFWLVLIFLFLFLIPAIGRMRDSSARRMLR
jgi:hypothetical protein